MAIMKKGMKAAVASLWLSLPMVGADATVCASCRMATGFDAYGFECYEEYHNCNSPQACNMGGAADCHMTDSYATNSCPDGECLTTTYDYECFCEGVLGSADPCSGLTSASLCHGHGTPVSSDSFHCGCECDQGYGGEYCDDHCLPVGADCDGGESWCCGAPCQCYTVGGERNCVCGGSDVAASVADKTVCASCRMAKGADAYGFECYEEYNNCNSPQACNMGGAAQCHMKTSYRTRTCWLIKGCWTTTYDYECFCDGSADPCSGMSSASLCHGHGTPVISDSFHCGCECDQGYRGEYCDDQCQPSGTDCDSVHSFCCGSCQCTIARGGDRFCQCSDSDVAAFV